ncbi:MAG: PD40 domain-containing protein [Chitinophagaceae bacterium]|nr:PD40 domain-containing protein [Chitinophagaceae bacterium]
MEPDGKFILLPNRSTEIQPVSVRCAIKTTLQLTKDTIDRYGPSFSPDGNSILFVSNWHHPLYEIYLMNLASGKITRITNNDRMDGSATFHPDGKRIFIHHSWTGIQQMVLQTARSLLRIRWVVIIPV